MVRLLIVRGATRLSLVSVFLAAIAIVPVKASAACLNFEPAEVVLEGSLIERTYPGRPNYENVEKGDEPEVVQILVLDHPVCVDGDLASDTNTEHLADVREVQVAWDAHAFAGERGRCPDRSSPRTPATTTRRSS